MLNYITSATRQCNTCLEVKELNVANFAIQNKKRFTLDCRNCYNQKMNKRYHETKYFKKKREPVKYCFKTYKSEYTNKDSEPVVYFESEEDILNQINELEDIKKLTIYDISIDEIYKINKDYSERNIN